MRTKAWPAELTFLAEGRKESHGRGEVRFPSEDGMTLAFVSWEKDTDYLCEGIRDMDGVYRGSWRQRQRPGALAQWVELNDGLWVGRWDEDGVHYLFEVRI
ncbi:MAG: hypothetical protein JST16_03635 [Bdellovibrionales bacterium]|nr:hypothetical protein [Bdellovibrionales bacterium]